MVNAIALQPLNGLQANNEDEMTTNDVAFLKDLTSVGLEKIREEIRLLRKEVVSKEVFEAVIKGNHELIKPVCARKIEELEQAMIERKMFETRVYAIASTISFLIGLLFHYLK